MQTYYVTVCREHGTVQEEAVLKSDHLADQVAVAKARGEKLAELEAWIDDLQSGMYINCVYCGHRYGPKDKVACSMQDVLKQHIEKCPKHPLSAARQQIAALKEEIDRLKRQVVVGNFNPHGRMVCRDGEAD